MQVASASIHAQINLWIALYFLIRGGVWWSIPRIDIKCLINYKRVLTVLTLCINGVVDVNVYWPKSVVHCLQSSLHRPVSPHGPKDADELSKSNHERVFDFLLALLFYLPNELIDFCLFLVQVAFRYQNQVINFHCTCFLCIVQLVNDSKNLKVIVSVAGQVSGIFKVIVVSYNWDLIFKLVFLAHFILDIHTHLLPEFLYVHPLWQLRRRQILPLEHISLIKCFVKQNRGLNNLLWNLLLLRCSFFRCFMFARRLFLGRLRGCFRFELL